MLYTYEVCDTRATPGIGVARSSKNIPLWRGFSTIVRSYPKSIHSMHFCEGIRVTHIIFLFNQDTTINTIPGMTFNPNSSPSPNAMVGGMRTMVAKHIMENTAIIVRRHT